MLSYDKNVVFEKLIEEGEYPDLAQKISETLVKLDNRLQQMLDKWLAGEEDGSYSYDGITLDVIKFRLGCSFIDSLYYMDMFMNKDGEKERFKNVMNTHLLLD